MPSYEHLSPRVVVTRDAEWWTQRSPGSSFYKRIPRFHLVAAQTWSRGVSRNRTFLGRKQPWALQVRGSGAESGGAIVELTKPPVAWEAEHAPRGSRPVIVIEVLRGFAPADR